MIKDNVLVPNDVVSVTRDITSHNHNSILSVHLMKYFVFNQHDKIAPIKWLDFR